MNKVNSAGKTGRETMQSLIGKGVEYCLPFYVDVHGVPKTKTVPVSHFDRMMRGSELFTGATLDGLGQGPHDDELALVPDPDAVIQLPWRPNVALIPGQLTYHEKPYPMCSRTILAKQVERAAKMGLRFNLGIECEVYIVRKDPAAYSIAPTIPQHPPRPPTTLPHPRNLEFLHELSTP
jgi:glutamine synthetase